MKPQRGGTVRGSNFLIVIFFSVFCGLISRFANERRDYKIGQKMIVIEWS